MAEQRVLLVDFCVALHFGECPAKNPTVEWVARSTEEHRPAWRRVPHSVK